MSFTVRARLVNPRLGTYFSIFAALFAAIFLISLIFEQLNTGEYALRLAMFAVPILLYLAIGAAVRSQEPLDYFAAGRRVPSGYTGLLLSIIGCGGTMLVCGAGAFFVAGFDALVLMMGGISGFVLMAMLLAPFYRKFGAYTVPSYLGRRFDSKPLRLTASMLCAVPILLVLAAELRVGSYVAARLTGFDVNLLTFVLAAAVMAVLLPGGKRGLTWAGVAQGVAVLLAVAIVSATVATLETSLPVPQLTIGPLVRNLVRNEVNQGLQLVSVSPFAFDLPGEGMQQLSKPYTQPFGSVGTLAFGLAVLMISTGFASAPWLLPRVAATPSVYEARKSLGWATVLFGVLLLTVSSLAVFMRDHVLDLVMAERVAALPGWADELIRLGFMTVQKSARDTGQITYNAMAFDRDSVLFAAGVASEMPRSFLFLAYAGAQAASLAATSATVMALAAILAEDVVQGAAVEPLEAPGRIWLARACIVAAGLAGAILTALAPTDPLRLTLWALALTSASLFPVLVLSIWWKRLTRAGAIGSMVLGFGVAALAILLSEAGVLGVPSAIAGVLGLPVATAAALALSSFLPETSRHDLEVVRDIRVPGGEIIYDREMRRLQIKKQPRV